MRQTYFYCRTCGNVHAKPLCSSAEADDRQAAPAIHGDECDFVQENGTPVPIRFRSKEVWRKWLDGRSLQLREKFVPIPGTDKALDTVNPEGYVDQVTLENRKALVLRALGARSGPDESPETVTPLAVDWTTREVGTFSVKRGQ